MSAITSYGLVEAKDLFFIISRDYCLTECHRSHLTKYSYIRVCLFSEINLLLYRTMSLLWGRHYRRLYFEKNTLLWDVEKLKELPYLPVIELDVYHEIILSAREIVDSVFKANGRYKVNNQNINGGLYENQNTPPGHSEYSGDKTSLLRLVTRRQESLSNSSSDKTLQHDLSSHPKHK